MTNLNLQMVYYEVLASKQTPNFVLPGFMSESQYSLSWKWPRKIIQSNSKVYEPYRYWTHNLGPL